jgi:hypothetical protein
MVQYKIFCFGQKSFIVSLKFIKCVLMKTKYVGKHAKFSWISGLVKGFFEGKGLGTKEYGLKDGTRIVAYAEDLPSVPFAAVEFSREADDIIVEFLPWGKRERGASTSTLASLVTPFGGGIIVQRELKKKEFMDRVEKEFWEFLDSRLSESSL